MALDRTQGVQASHQTLIDRARQPTLVEMGVAVGILEQEKEGINILLVQILTLQEQAQEVFSMLLKDIHRIYTPVLTLPTTEEMVLPHMEVAAEERWPII